MPSGRVANLLAAIKLINGFRLGECKVTEEDIRRAGGLGQAIKDIIAADNDRCYRLFDKLRAVQTEGTLTAPDIRGFNLPEFQICEEQTMLL